MNAAAPKFYVTGGTVPRDAPSYIVRQADTELVEGLRQGQFCYVLTSRQMGKSSLMVRAATQLRQEGTTCAILDLTAIGQNLDAERWYGGLLNQLGQHVGLEDELDDFWLAPSPLGPMQKWMQALQHIVLKQCPGSLVIFIDEIDAVRSLPFSADEFFAGIRECYNRRVEASDFARLTFCLLGVATPSDLIRDTRTTPFNIGQRIELTDFTPEEAAPLTAGLFYHPPSAGDTDAQREEPQSGRPPAEKDSSEGHNPKLLVRVLYWTNGHPYLTQRLCLAVAETLRQPPASAPYSLTSAHVDKLCRAMFLSAGAREKDDNLLFARDRILRSELDRAALLDLYHYVRRGQRVRYDETSPLISVLLLSGIVRVNRGFLAVRNRIYNEVFDHTWIRAAMPDAELRRQETAFREGVYRAAALALILLLAMGGLTAWALYERQVALQRGMDAEIAAKSASYEAKRANYNADKMTAAMGIAKARRSEAEQEKTAKTKALAVREKALQDLTRQKQFSDRLLYIATMELIPQRYERGEFDGMRALLTETKRSPYRGFEWGYWNRLANPARLTLKGHVGPVLSVAFSPEGLRLVTGSDDRTARIWDTTAGREMLRLNNHRSGVACVTFSPNGRRALTASLDRTVRVWDGATGRLLLTLPVHPDIVTAAAFSRDGRWMATGCGDGIVRVWDTAGHERRKIPAHTDGVTCVAWSPDGRHLATGGRDARVKVWVAETGQEMPALKGHLNAVTSLSYSADGQQILSASEDNTARITNVDNGASEREPIVLRGHSGWIYSAAFSTDGRCVVTGSADGTARVWDSINGRQAVKISANAGGVRAVAFSPDGRRIATGHEDGTAALWDVGPGQTFNPAGTVRAAAISPDGRFVVTAGDDGAAGPAVTLWDGHTGRALRKIKGHSRIVNTAVFSPGGRSFLTGADDGTAMVWDCAAGLRRLTLKTSADAVLAAAFSPDGRRILTGGSDGKARLWDAADGHLRLTLTPRANSKDGEASHVTAVAFCPDGRRVVTAGIGRSATIWDARTGRELMTLKGHAKPIDSVAVSFDGRWIVTGSQDGTAKVWEAAKGKLLLTLRGHAGSVTSVAYARDGRRILTSGEEGTARLWDAETGRELLTLKGHTGAVHSAAWSPDGRRILTGSSDGTAIVWHSY